MPHRPARWKGWQGIERGKLGLSWDHVMFDYDDIRDLRTAAAPGSEPLYSFEANIFQLFLSLYF